MTQQSCCTGELTEVVIACRRHGQVKSEKKIASGMVEEGTKCHPQLRSYLYMMAIRKGRASIVKGCGLW